MIFKFPSPCINNIQGEGMVNIHYKNRYNKFIQIIVDKGVRNLNGYTEIHHIIPKCLKGQNTPNNLIKLTLREHFLAHWLLWKAYPDYLPLASAFLQMNNKNPKIKFDFQGRITSRTYEKLKNDVYNSLKELTTNKVRVKDEYGNVITLSKQEYADQDKYKFHTIGKVYVFDKEINEWIYVLSECYQNNKDRYITRLSASSPEEVQYQFIDLETNEILKMTKNEAKVKNKNYGYKRLKHLQKHQVVCIDENGARYNVSLNEYVSNKHTSLHSHLLKNKVIVFDTKTKKHIQISKEKYQSDRTRYQTTTKGKVLAKNSIGETVLVSTSEFKNGNYVGQTKGFRLVKDKTTGSFVQVSEQEYLNNKEKYVGPNKGRVNIIDKITGERKQIPKDEFDTNRYSGLGNKKFLFKCRNILTGKEKYINIYEWHLVKDQYEIIEMDKFTRAMSEK